MASTIGSAAEEEQVRTLQLLAHPLFPWILTALNDVNGDLRTYFPPPGVWSPVAPDEIGKFLWRFLQWLEMAKGELHTLRQHAKSVVRNTENLILNSKTEEKSGVPALERKRDESKGPAKSRPKKQKKKKAHDDEWREEDTSDEESSDEDTSTAEEVEVFSDATSEDYEPQPAIPRSRGRSRTCNPVPISKRAPRQVSRFTRAICNQLERMGPAPLSSCTKASAAVKTAVASAKAALKEKRHEQRKRVRAK